VPEFSQQQGETIHFNYLRSVGGGVLRVACTFEEHRTKLLASLREPQRADLNAEFVTAFIRPHGLRTPATPLFSEAVGKLLRSSAPAPRRTPFWVIPLRWAMWPTFQLLLRISRAAIFRDDWNRKERERERRREERRRVQQERGRMVAAKEQERARVRSERTAREAVAVAEKTARQRIEAGHKRARERAKAARIREKRRVALRARLKRGANRWLNRWRPGQEGQAP